MDKDMANKEEMNIAEEIVELDEEDYSDEIMNETFEVNENEYEIKNYHYETWNNILMETAVYYCEEEKKKEIEENNGNTQDTDLYEMETETDKVNVYEKVSY
ncbi:uncharacterized protein ACNLHF_014380 [Anomaloglossus baeobatrachus]